MSNLKHRLNKIKAFAFDVDGVFTDGQVYLLPDKEFVRAVNIKDGYAIQHTIKSGYPVAIISGGASEEVRKRFRNLGVTDIYMKSSNKWEDYEDFRMKYSFEHEEILYMGDDIPDLPVMKRVGFASCPADAAHEIREVSSYISDKPGGKGCVRDIVEQVLRLHNNWLNEIAFEW
jgi:3-deoxy-D-manno-octulosonate 8-phosphate phosphatase (KDO 8-P phosphatase)